MSATWTIRTRRRVAAVLAATVVAVGAAGCGGDSGPDSGAASAGEGGAASANNAGAANAKSVNILLPFPLNLNYVQGTMASVKYFGEEGLKADWKSVDGSALVIQQMVAGRADYGVVTSSAVLQANAKGAKLRAIATARHDAGAVLSVVSDSSVRSIADLRGKKIGIPSQGDGSLPVVTAALNDAGMKVGKDVRLVVVGEGGPAVANALKTKRIAAYSAGVSDAPGLAVGGGVQLRSIMPAKYAGLPDTVFATTQKVLDDPAQRDVAVKIARALIRGAAAAKADPAAVETEGCKLMPDQCTDRKRVKVAVQMGIVADNPADGARPAFMDPAKTKVYVDAMRSTGELKGDVSVETTFDNAYVDQIAKGVTR